MEVLGPLAAIAGLSGMFLLGSKKKRQGFEDSINSSVSTRMDPEHVNYIRKANTKYNPISNLINPSMNVLLPDDFTEKDIQSQQNRVKNAIRSAAAKPSNPSFLMKPSYTANILLNPNSSGVPNLIKKCEAIKSLNCNAFDDSTFSSACGMCHEGGVNSKGDKIVGGLFVTQDDKDSAEAYRRQKGETRATYAPTVGECDPRRFTTNKSDCIKLQKQLDCIKKQTYNNDGCIKCYGDDVFSYVDPNEVDTVSPILKLVGSGSLTITKLVGDDSFTPIKIQLSETPNLVKIDNFKEGDALKLSVNGTTKPYISGYLQGNTSNGLFTVDIIKLIANDLVSGSKPSMAGTSDLGGEYYTKIVPLRTKSTMDLLLQNTFTFIDPSEEEAISCLSSPFIAKESSAKFLESGVCYKKGQSPGNYSEECVQNIFTSAGCTTEGTEFPNGSFKSKKIQVDTNGKKLSVGEIANNIYNLSQVAYTGTTQDGKKLPITEWSKYSEQCTGKRLISPCSIEGDGPHSGECLSYLWLNKGATDNIEGGEGPTYRSSKNFASLKGQDDNFCTVNGYLSPVNPDGTINQDKVRGWNGFGRTDLIWVKGNMDKIHKLANDNTLSNEEREPWIKYCYGITYGQFQAQNQSGGSEIANAPSKLGSMTDSFGNNIELYYGINQVNRVPSWAALMTYMLTPYFMNGNITTKTNIKPFLYQDGKSGGTGKHTFTIADGFKLYIYRITENPRRFQLMEESITGTQVLNNNNQMFWFILVPSSYGPPLPMVDPNMNILSVIGGGPAWDAYQQPYVTGPGWGDYHDSIGSILNKMRQATYSAKYDISVLDSKEGRTKTPFETKINPYDKVPSALATITGPSGTSTLYYGINQKEGDPNWSNIAMDVLQPYFNLAYITPGVNITRHNFQSPVGTISVAPGFTVYGYINISGSPNGMSLDSQYYEGQSTINKANWYFIIVVPSTFPKPPVLIGNPGNTSYNRNLYRGDFKDDLRTIFSRIRESRYGAY